MGYLCRPAYYRRFSCIASACTDTCCAGWEIDVDEEALEKYRRVRGPFGERLRREIVLPEDPESGEPAHFRLKAHDRCPFLNEKNLCDIYTELGSEYLSYICTHHPRFYEWYANGREAGLGLVCEAAAELILEKTGVPEFEILWDDAAALGQDSCGQENALFCGTCEPGAEQALAMEKTMPGTEPQSDRLLFDARDAMFRIIKSGADLDMVTDRLFSFAKRVQAEYDDLLYGEGEAAGAAESAGAPWSSRFWSEEILSRVLDAFRGLEINDLAWWELLGRIQERLPEVLSRRGAFHRYYQERLYEYEQLLIYFLYRYFMKSRLDGGVRERVNFALLSTGMIELVGIAHWMEHGKLSHREQINICKLYAKEIEYDEENVDGISHFPAL